MAEPYYRFSIRAQTDVGKKRARNEDAFSVVDTSAAGVQADAVFVVADGMGGLQAGDVASQETTRIVTDVLTTQLRHSSSDVREALHAAIQEANTAVHAIASGQNRLPVSEDAPTAERGDRGENVASAAEPMEIGTTCIAVVARGGRLFLAHVGDSRAYRLRAAELTRLTRDHSFIEERVRAGEITEAEARRSRFRNVITRAIGVEPQVSPDILSEEIAPNDLFLVCTDGLTSMVSEAEIARLLQDRKSDLSQLAANLVDAANSRGGVDNITVVLARALSVEAGDTENGTSSAPTPQTLPLQAMNRAAPRVTPRGTPRVRSAAPMAATPLAGTVQEPAPAAPPLIKRRKRPSVIGLLVSTIGIAALLFALALAVSPALRTKTATILSGKSGPTSPRAALDDPIASTPAAAALDLRSVQYGPPERLLDLSVRSDLLVCSPAGFLYFVRGIPGTVGELHRVSLTDTPASGLGPALPDPVAAPEQFDPDTVRSRIENTIVRLPVPPPLSPPISRSRVFVTTDRVGNVYISRTAQRVIEKWSPEGRLLLTLKGFDRPEAIAVGEDGSLYVVDGDLIHRLRAQPRSPANNPTSSPGAPSPRAPSAPRTGSP